MNWFPFSYVLMVLIAGAMLLAIPRFSRPDIYFAVTVDPAFRDSGAGRAIGRRYAIQMISWIVLSILAVALLAFYGKPQLASLAGMIVAIGSILSLVLANRSTKPHAAKPNPIREASLIARREHMPGGWILWALPFAILAGSGVYLQLHWDAIPERFPIHFGFDGKPDGWATRTPASVYWSLAMGAAICLMMTIMGWAVLHSRRISMRGTAARTEQSFRSMNVTVMLVVEYLMASLFAAIPIVSIFHMNSAEFTAFINVALTVFLLAVLLIVFFRYGQGGTRLAGHEALTSPPIGDRTPDECWKWGLIYYNRDDPAVMVEKRFGIGYTMNFGNVRAWLLLGALLALPLVSILFFRP